MKGLSPARLEYCDILFRQSLCQAIATKRANSRRAKVAQNTQTETRNQAKSNGRRHSARQPSWPRESSSNVMLLTSCRVEEPAIQAFTDRRLTAQRARVLENYLAAHPDIAERVRAYRAQNRALRKFFKLTERSKPPFLEHLMKALQRQLDLAHRTQSASKSAPPSPAISTQQGTDRISGQAVTPRRRRTARGKFP